MINWKGFGRKQSWSNLVIILAFTGGMEVNHTKSVSTVGVLIEIQTKHLLKTSLEHYL
jgi:hypothetical protein